MRFKSLFSKSNPEGLNGNKTLDIPSLDPPRDQIPSIEDPSATPKDSSSSSSPLNSRSSVQDSLYSNDTSLEPSASPSSTALKHQTATTSSEQPSSSTFSSNPPPSHISNVLASNEKMQTLQSATADASIPAHSYDLPTPTDPIRDPNLVSNQPPSSTSAGFSQNVRLAGGNGGINPGVGIGNSPNTTNSNRNSNSPGTINKQSFPPTIDSKCNPLLQLPPALNKDYSKSPDQRVPNARRSQPPISNLQRGPNSTSSTNIHSKENAYWSPQVPNPSIPPRSASVASFSSQYKTPPYNQVHSIDLMDIANIPVRQPRLKSQSLLSLSALQHQALSTSSHPSPALSYKSFQSPIPDLPGVGPAPSRSRFQQHGKPRLASASQVLEFVPRNTTAASNQSQSDYFPPPRAASRQSVILCGNEMDNNLASASLISLDNLIPAVNKSKFAPPGSRAPSVRSASHASLRNFTPAGSAATTPNLSNIPNSDLDPRHSQQRFMPSPKYMNSPSSHGNPHHQQQYPNQYQNQQFGNNKSKSAMDLRSAALSPNQLRPSLSPTMEDVVPVDPTSSPTNTNTTITTSTNPASRVSSTGSTSSSGSTDSSLMPQAQQQRQSQPQQQSPQTLSSSTSKPSMSHGFSLKSKRISPPAPPSLLHTSSSLSSVAAAVPNIHDTRRLNKLATASSPTLQTQEKPGDSVQKNLHHHQPQQILQNQQQQQYHQNQQQYHQKQQQYYQQQQQKPPQQQNYALAAAAAAHNNHSNYAAAPANRNASTTLDPNAQKSNSRKPITSNPKTNIQQSNSQKPNTPNHITIPQPYLQPPPKSPSRKNFPSPTQVYPNEQGQTVYMQQQPQPQQQNGVAPVDIPMNGSENALAPAMKEIEQVPSAVEEPKIQPVLSAQPRYQENTPAVTILESLENSNSNNNNQPLNQVTSSSSANQVPADSALNQLSPSGPKLAKSKSKRRLFFGGGFGFGKHNKTQVSA